MKEKNFPSLPIPISMFKNIHLVISKFSSSGYLLTTKQYILYHNLLFSLFITSTSVPSFSLGGPWEENHSTQSYISSLTPPLLALSSPAGGETFLHLQQLSPLLTLYPLTFFQVLLLQFNT
jgi:hypothetical protein